MHRLENEELIGGFTVGDWLAEPMRNRVSLDGEGVQVEPKVMGVLMCLVRHSGKTVTKDTFFEEVWQGTIVSEDVLSRCISELRRVLHDDAREPRFVETIRKTGYRLIAQVGPYTPDSAPAAGAPVVSPSDGTAPLSPAATSELAPGTDRSRFLTWLAVGMVVLGSISLAAIIIFRTVSTGTSVQRFVGPLQTVPYTSYRGLELDPALSPSGDQVAFAWDDDFTADFDIYLKQTGAESPLRLTISEASERFPTWSPDGLHLAFVRSTQTSDAVYTIPSIGGKERKLVDFGLRRIRGLSWSPEGELMAVSAQAEVGGAAAIYLVRPDSLGFTQLTHPPVTHFGDVGPAFSPDGAWLAFIRSLSSDVQDVYVMSMESREIRAMTADSTAITGLDWTPDGQDIIFASFRGYMSSLWRSPLHGGSPEWIVTASLGNVLEHPSMARLTDRLTYVRRSSNANVWKLSGIEKGLPEATPVIFSTGWDSHPAISPAGRRLAFVSDQSGRPEIWVSDLDGRNLVRLTSESGRPLTPHWSRDGSKLAFALRRMGQADIYVVDAEGGSPAQITRTPSEELFPYWSHDGRWIIFASDRTGQWELWRTRPDGTTEQQITRSGALLGRPGWSGRFVYLVKPGEPGIWRQTLDTQSDTPELLIDDLATQDFANWSLTRNGIYYIRRVDGIVTLAFHDSESGRTSDVYDLALVPDHPALSASSDGMEVVFTQLDEDAGDIQMVDSFK